MKMNRLFATLSSVGLLLAVVVPAASQPAAPAPATPAPATPAPAAPADGTKVDFVKQVRPIFAETCYSCHGAKKHKGDLSLHTPEAFQKGGESGPVVVPGKPEESKLYQLIILPGDHEDIMPAKGDPLRKEQTDLIAQWIREGASFGEWKGDAEAPEVASASEGPKAAPLPEVPAAAAAAVQALQSGGALCLPLAQGINLLDVGFTSNADQVDDSKLALLTPVAQQVYSLNLANTKVTDGGLAPLAGLTNLRRLHLEKTGIGDAGLAHVKGLTNLEYLNLYGTKVTDAGLDQLAGLTNLKNLYLWQSQVTDAGVAKLQAALPNCKIDNGWKEPAATPQPAAAPAQPPATPPAQ